MLKPSEILFIQSGGLAGTPPETINGHKVNWDMAKPKWMERGHDDMEKRAKEQAALRRGGPMRFWMKPHTTTQVVFVDDEPARINEHGLRIGGKWGHFETCIGEENGCDLCLAGDTPYYIAFWTIIDRTRFTDRSGKERGDEVRLFGAKSTVMVKLTRRSEKRRAAQKAKGLKETGIAGLVFDISRGDAKTPGTGDDFELAGKASASLLVDKDGKPITAYDYEEVLAPNDERRAQYARIITGSGKGAGVSY